MGKKWTLISREASENAGIADPLCVPTALAKSLFEQVGGIVVLRNVTRVFYDKVYRHPWLKTYFEHIDQDHIASQQAEFMQGVLGGPAIYRGRTPGTAHPHIEITAKAFDLRQELLRQTLVELCIHPDITKRWLALDEAFRKRLVKDRANCRKRYGSDKIIVAPPQSQ